MQPFEFQCRAVPENPQSVQYIFPARLKDFGKKIKLGDLEPPEWFTNEEFNFTVDWENRRWGLDESDDEAIRTGAIRIAQAVDLFFDTHRPNLVIVYNEIDHPQRLASLAAKVRHIPVRILERSPFMGVWMEADGLFDKSRAFGAELPDSAQSSDKLVRMLRDQTEGFRVGQHRANSSIDLFRRPIILLTLDNFLWTACIDNTLGRYRGHYRPINDVQSVVDILASTALELGGIVLVKPHPSCREADALVLGPGAELYRGDLPSALTACDVLVGWNSKVLFNSLALEKPTLALGPNPVIATGGCYVANSIGAIPQLVLDALHQVDLPRKLQLFAKKLPSLVERIYFDIDESALFCRGAPFEALLDELYINANADGAPDLPNVGSWYQLAAGKPFDRQRGHAQLTSSLRPAIMFEVTRLDNDKLRHSGISRYIRELVSGLIASPDLHVTAASWRDGHWHYVDGDPLLDEVEYDLFHSPHEPLRDVACRRRVITVHDVVHLKLRNYYPQKHVEYKNYQVYRVLRSIRSNDAIICDSFATRRDLLCYSIVPSEKVFVCHLGVRSLDTAADTLEAENRIFAVYQSDPRKNTSVYLEIAAALADSAPDWRLSLVVSSSAKADLEDELAARSLMNVDLHDEISDEQMARLMRTCRFSLFLPFYEGFGLPLIESCVAGLPVIAAASSSLLELDGPGVKFVSPFSTDEAVDAVLTWASNPAMIPDSNVVRDHAIENHNWAGCVTNTLEIYHNVLSEFEPRRAVSGSARRPEEKINPKSAIEYDMQYDAKVAPWRYMRQKAFLVLGDFVRYRPTVLVSVLAILAVLLAYALSSTVFDTGTRVAFSLFLTCSIFLVCYLSDISAVRRLIDFFKHVRH